MFKSFLMALLLTLVMMFCVAEATVSMAPNVEQEVRFTTERMGWFNLILPATAKGQIARSDNVVFRDSERIYTDKLALKTGQDAEIQSRQTMRVQHKMVKGQVFTHTHLMMARVPASLS